MTEQIELIALFKPPAAAVWCGRDARRAFASSAPEASGVVGNIELYREMSDDRGQQDIIAAFRAIAANVVQSGEHYALQVDDDYYDVLVDPTPEGWEMAAVSSDRPPLRASGRRKEQAYEHLVLAVLERYGVLTHA